MPLGIGGRCKSFLAIGLLIILLLSPLHSANVAAKPSEVLEGRLEALALDYVDGGIAKYGGTFTSSETRYYLRMDDGRRVELKVPSDLKPSFLHIGRRVKLQALKISEGKYEALSIFKLAEVTHSEEEEVPLRPPVLGPQRTLVLLVKFADIPNEPMDPDDIKVRIFSYMFSYKYGETTHQAYGLRGIIEKSSFGRASVYGNIYGWYEIGKSTKYGGADLCSPGRDYEQAFIDAVNKLNTLYGVKVRDHDRIILYFNVDTATFGYCAFSYVGYIVAEFAYGKRVVSVQWMPTDEEFGTAPGVIAHEYGHQMGLVHTGYVYEPYDSPWDIMSGAYYGLPYKHQDYAAVQKWLLGWLTYESKTFKNLRGTVTIKSLESLWQGSIMLVIVEITANTFWTIEVRAKEDLDRDLPAEGVIVHYVDLTLSDWFAKPVDRTPGDGTLKNANFRLKDKIVDTVSKYGIERSLRCKVIGETGYPRSFRIRCPPSCIWEELSLSNSTDPSSVGGLVITGVPNPFIFAVGVDGCLYRTHADPASGELLPWIKEICEVGSNPPSISQDVEYRWGKVMVVQRKADNSLYYAIFDLSGGQTVKGWTSMEFIATVDAAVAFDEWTYTFHVIASNNKGTYYRKYDWDGDPLADWIKIGIPSAMQPSAAAYAGILHVAIIRDDGAIFFKQYNIETDTWWTKWKFVGRTKFTPAIYAYPYVTPNGWGEIIWVHDKNDILYHRPFSPDGLESPPISLKLKTNSRPHVVCGFRGFLDCYILAKNLKNVIYYRYFDPFCGPYDVHISNWIPVAPGAASPPVGDGDDQTSLYIVKRKTNDLIDITLLA